MGLFANKDDSQILSVRMARDKLESLTEASLEYIMGNVEHGPRGDAILRVVRTLKGCTVRKSPMQENSPICVMSCTILRLLSPALMYAKFTQLSVPLDSEVSVFLLQGDSTLDDFMNGRKELSPEDLLITPFPLKFRDSSTMSEILKRIDQESPDGAPSDEEIVSWRGAFLALVFRSACMTVRLEHPSRKCLFAHELALWLWVVRNFHSDHKMSCTYRVIYSSRSSSRRAWSFARRNLTRPRI